MFAPIARRSALRSTVASNQSRGVATLADLKRRIVSTGSIGKLTKAMKMVAVARLRSAQDQLLIARTFSRSVEQAWAEPEAVPVNPDNLSGAMILTMTSDRGLCGGVNNQILRTLKPHLKKTLNKDTQMMFIGDKGRSALEREFGKYFVTSISETGKVKRSTFRQVAMIAELLSSTNYLTGHVFYNKYVNTAISEPTAVPFFPASVQLANTDIASKYENEGDEETYANFWEFRMAARLFTYTAEAYASETAARMTAMTNSSKNAGEMLNSITQQYNRQRQAKITNELTEIVSGAAAAEEMV